jgi:hypothetical protein
MLEMLELMFQAPDVTATQQMGVQLSNAAKREGVIIIQNQNVEVMAKIGPPVLKVLRLLQENTDNRLEPVLLSPPEQREPVEACCDHFYQNRIGWEEMQATMKQSYIGYVVSKFRTRREAAEFLGVGPTYLSKMISGPGGGNL